MTGQHDKHGKDCWEEISKVELDDYLLSLHFFSGIKVLVDRPHVVNPKLLTAETIAVEDIPFASSPLIDFLIDGDFCEESIKDVIKNIDSSDKPPIQNIEKNQGQVIFRHVLPKRFNMYKEVLEVVVLDFFEDSATFFPKKCDVYKSPVTPSIPYKFRLIEKRIQLEVLKCLEETEQISETKKWLAEKVLPKVSRWCQNVPKHPILPSIQLVPPKDYNETLHYLKKKYAKQFVEIWPTYNVTDPIKYVYEDLSIAAYLITIWAQERKNLNLEKKQTFVDLGCGHGLLDHILQSEGHNGIGIDLRKRKMWAAYGPETKLIEMTFEPSDKQLYPDYDWIIGNHPDELTPWIPVIAARSSYNMKVFLLPCCFYTFDGKYARTHHDFTQYQSYINFIKLLCETMGFNCQLDRLRIPSTKRTCLVCTSRTYKEGDEGDLEIIRNDFIKTYSKKTEREVHSEPDEVSHEDDIFMAISDWAPQETNTAAKWSADFIPREVVEKTRNCTSLDKKVIHEAVMTIVNALLVTENYLNIERNAESILWNKGGMLKMSSLCNLLNQQVFAGMKNQRGGFQTLIRNHHYIFEVTNDVVQLKVPSTDISSSPENSLICKKKRKSYRNKTKPVVYNRKECFFHFHHPQGCPLSSSHCTFSHEELPTTP